MDISLTTMRCFVEAARQENFTAAAQKLYTAQPNLSKKISALEKVLGVRLFRRDGRRVSLTSAGRLLCEEWSEALEQIERSIRLARKLEKQSVEVLRLGILDGMDISAQELARLEAFRTRHPRLELRPERAGVRRLWQGFREGKFDMIAVTELQGCAHETPPACLRRVVGSSGGVIAINRRSEPANRSVLTLPMLNGENFIILSQDEGEVQSYRVLRDICRRHGFEPSIIRQADSIETMLLCVETGAGITLLPGNSRLAANPNIRFVPVADIRFDSVLYWRDDPSRPAAQALADEAE